MRGLGTTAVVVALAGDTGCAPSTRAYEDVPAVDRLDASAVDSARGPEDAAIDRAPVVAIDRSVLDENGRRAARVFSFLRSCGWPRSANSAQSIFVQLVAGFDAGYQRYVDCALRSATCAEYGSCVVGFNPPSSLACWGELYNADDDVFDCAAISRGQARCSDRGCNDLRQCPAIAYVSRCDGDIAVDCNDLRMPIRACPDIHPELRCAVVHDVATCDIPDAPPAVAMARWTCDGTALVQRSNWPFGTLHSALALLPRTRETRFDCARLGLECDPRGACVDPAGECGFDPDFDSIGRLDSATQSYRHCFAGRWYAYPIVPQS